ncbi:hypothetical protein [Maribellus sediminis]|uniref:hypothetical protein n=1 Tax=Maribellus sediminis TaxID=2696285 RepID=UPI001431AE2E|nr:hypothetical protein [Maribellus sediminis]
MKHLLLATLLLSGLCSLAQEKRMTIQGKIVDARGNPVPDVYIINLVSNEKDITLNNGVFTIKIFPTDSLILSHISYFRKVVTANALLLNPVVTLESESINVEEVTVSPEQKTDADNAFENIEQIDWDPRPKVGDGFSEADRVSQTMKENNRLLRTEAASVSLLKFSVGDMLAKWKKKRQRRKSRR